MGGALGFGQTTEAVTRLTRRAKSRRVVEIVNYQNIAGGPVLAAPCLAKCSYATMVAGCSTTPPPWEQNRMGLFRRVDNVASGRYRHWNEHNNQAISDLWYRTEEFPEGLQLVFREFLGLTLWIMDMLLSPDNEDKLIEVDPLKLERRQYTKLHATLLEGLVGNYAKLNPGLADSLLGALTLLTGRDPENSKVLQAIHSMGELNAGEIGRVMWGHLVEITCSHQGATMIEAYPFIALFGSASAEIFGDIRMKLSKLEA